MNLDAAKNGKAEIFQKAFQFREIPAAFAEGHSEPTFQPVPDSEVGDRIRRARLRRQLDAAEQIAVGLMRDPAHEGDLKLVLLLQNERLRHHPIVERATRLIGPHEVEIVTTGPAQVQMAANPGLCRPLRMGASIGHVDVTAGTLGCFAGCRSTRAIGILSNNHILANSNAGQPGDVILQPGKLDGGVSSDLGAHIARLARFHPIDFSIGGINLVDCAFAVLLDDVGHEAAFIGDQLCVLSAGIVDDIEDLIIDEVSVTKCGRTTAPKDGTIFIASADNVTVKFPRNQFARFDGQIGVRGINEVFSGPGDSGSLVVTTDGRPVGLLFAATTDGITYANRIQSVLDLLHIDIRTGP